MWVKDGVAIAQGTTHTYKFTIPQQDEGLRAFKVRSKANRVQLWADSLPWLYHPVPVSYLGPSKSCWTGWLHDFSKLTAVYRPS